MNTLDSVWRQLELDKSTETLSYQRVEASSAQQFIGVRRLAGRVQPERVLLLRLPVHLVRKVSSNDRHQGLRLDPIEDQLVHGSGFIALVLTKIELRDIFTVLVADLLEAVGAVPAPADQLRTFLKRLGRWQDLLAHYNPAGLSSNARQGLYGELWTMRWLLDVGHIPGSKVLGAWVGPDRAPQDFLFTGAALEVKTTAGRSAALRIGGLWQLDPGNSDPLFLMHLPMVISVKDGETLPALVADLVSCFSSDTALSTRFEARLLAADYLHTQADMYRTEKWLVHAPRLMAVTDSFPRLHTDQLPAAIVAAAYELDAAALGPWLCQPDILFKVLA
jgi:hypothetical protein